MRLQESSHNKCDHQIVINQLTLLLIVPIITIPDFQRKQDFVVMRAFLQSKLYFSKECMSRLLQMKKDELFSF